ncbi:MAG TPA: DUF1015 domain-containing protein [Thermoanaerobaculia bacterium]|nr:DUF1015 domain-containing protein [Thermoanaerobaculia bacterium]
MRLHAFHGLRYARPAAEAGALAAPPYDQIDDPARDRLHAASPHQFAHLIRPAAADGGDPYARAAELHRRWLGDGIVAREARPALYPYVIELAGGGRRLGIAGLVGLEDARRIRPHEQTIDKPFADRLALLEATRVDLEPVLLLSEDGGRLDALLTEDLEGIEPLVRHQDADGHRHLLYRIEEPARIARYREALAGPGAIADGHHRYKVAQAFAERHDAAAESAAAAKLAVVTSLDSPALTIDPIHRALRAPADLARLAPLAAARAPFRGDGGTAFAAAVAAAPQPALGIRVTGAEPEVWSFPATGRPAVAVLRDAVLPALGLAPAAATDGTVLYRAQPEELWAQIEGGEVGTALFLPPMQPAEFAAAIAEGEMLPPKSTRFLPKVMSGLVWAAHDTALA